MSSRVIASHGEGVGRPATLLISFTKITKPFYFAHLSKQLSNNEASNDRLELAASLRLRDDSNQV